MPQKEQTLNTMFWEAVFLPFELIERGIRNLTKRQKQKDVKDKNARRS